MSDLDTGLPADIDRCRAIVQAQAELIVLSRADGTLVWANAAYARGVGQASEALPGRSLVEHLPEDDRAGVRRVVAEVFADGDPRATEGRLLGPGDGPHWIEWTHRILVEAGERLLLSVGHEVQDSEAFVRTISDSLPLRIAYVGRDLRYRFVNLAHCRRFDRRREDILGRTREELLGQPTPAPIAEHIDAALAGQPQRFEYEERFGGEMRRFEVQLVPDAGADGHVRGYFYTGLDITDRARAEQALRELGLEAQRRADVLRLVTEAIPTSVVVVGADARYRFVNRAFEAYCGLSREQIIGRTAMEVLGADEIARRRPFMQRALAGESVSFVLDYPAADGTTWLELTCIPLRLGGGEVDGFVGLAQDITAQRREQDRLTELAQRDPLTGLLNRAGFELCLAHRIREGGGASLGLLYIDLDRFKPVNDRHGHPVGDRLLQSVAQRLRELVRPTDAVARLGGDEFAILLVDLREPANAQAVAEKVVVAIGRRFEVDGLALEIGTSVGVAFGADPQGGSEALIRRADAMLYRAKALGRGRYAG